MFVFEIPEVGEGVVEAEIVKWLIEEGDFVQADQAVCEVMTDKATIEISSPKSGRIHKIFGESGDIVEVHTPFLEIDVDASGSAPAQNTVKESKPEPKQESRTSTPPPNKKVEPPREPQTPTSPKANRQKKRWHHLL